MFIIIDSAKSRWADEQHTCLYAHVKTSEGWRDYVCHRFSIGFEKEIWDARDEFEFQPAENEQSESAIVKLVQEAIQNRLDEKAREKLYDDSRSLISYMNSTNETFKSEAEKFNRWRDDCWSASWQIWKDYHDGKRPKPTFNDVMNEIPLFEWSLNYPVTPNDAVKLPDPSEYWE